jgi:hypothetical protein
MVSTQIVSHVVPFPQLVPANQISQIELALLLSLRGRLSQLESQIATAEESLRARLEAGGMCGRCYRRTQKRLNEIRRQHSTDEPSEVGFLDGVDLAHKALMPSIENLARKRRDK